VQPPKLGHNFETRVCQALRRNNYFLIKRNDWRKNLQPERDQAEKREYDLLMFSMNDWQVVIIECKAHYNDRLVGLGQVREFYDKLEVYNGRHARRMMVTDTDYTPPAREYASSRNIELVNGSELKELEHNNDILGRVIGKGLEKIISVLSGDSPPYQ